LTTLQSLGAQALGRIDAETAHGLALRALRAGFGGADRAAPDPILATRLAGMTLDNPVGLAAGFDKDAVAPAALLRAGFGFVECGTTTPRPQAGNPRPRLFRLREDGAVINRMGFNNAGVERFAENLAKPKGDGVVGANIGANKDSPDRIADYVLGLERLWGLADYFTLNVSSPNTPGLRALQGREALDDMLGRIAACRARLEVGGRTSPIFLKVAPDLNDGDVGDIVEAATRHRLDGLIVANTTLARPSSLRGHARAEGGGLSGAPLMAASTALLGRFFEAAAGRLALIGVGGVASGADAYAKIRAGADAVQLYTALAYRGPGLVRDIKRDLATLLRADGFRGVAEAVGAR
jgi:dihydroorotate dehydrogenase